MISLKHYLEVPWGGDAQPAAVAPRPALEQALRQALRLALEEFARRGPDDEVRKARLESLLARLDGPLKALEPLEIANEGLIAFEPVAAPTPPKAAEVKPEPGEAQKQAELATALQRALRMLVEGASGLSRGSAADGDSASLLHRLDGRLEPFDALEIGNGGAALLESEADRRRSLEAELGQLQRSVDDSEQLTAATLAALQTVLESYRQSGDAAGPAVGPGRQPAAELVLRLKRRPTPADLAQVARETEDLIWAEATRLREHSQDSESAERAERIEALTQAMHSVLATLATLPPGTSGKAGPSLVALAGWLPRLTGEMAPAAVEQMAAQTVKALHELESPVAAPVAAETANRGREQAEMDARAAKQALELLLGGWPVPGRDEAERKALRKRMDELLLRLEHPRAPFDVVEVASDALELLERAAESERNTANDQGRRRAERQTDLVESLLQGLRLLIGRLPGSQDGGAEPDNASGRGSSALLQRLEGPLEPFDVFEIVNESLLLAEQDARAVQERQRGMARAFQSMISMLTETVAALSAAKTRSVTRLQLIEQRIEQVSQLEDLHTLKTSLAECLQAVREASASQQRQSTDLLQSLEREVQRARGGFGESSKVDSVESPRKEERKPAPATADYMVVFVLDRHGAIATRFGDEVLHGVLRFVNQRLKESLASGDRLVRWKGAAFLASLSRTGNLQDIRAELSSVASIHVPPSIDMGNRSIRLPVSLSWAVFPNASYPSLDVMFEKVDEFISRAQGPAAN